ncbi:MAG: DUF4870 domain-containing protein [Steroidobacteraceae bacterium]
MNEPKPAAATVPGAAPTQNERTWGMIAHLSAFAVFVVPLGGNIIAPLIIWLTRRDTSAFVAMEAKEALNFNISVALGWVVCGLLMFVLVGIPLGVILFVCWLALTIFAAIKASEGTGYRYPFSLRLVK